MADAIAAARRSSGEQPPGHGAGRSASTACTPTTATPCRARRHLDVRGQRGDGDDRPLGLRQVDRAALHQPHARGDPGRARRGPGDARRRSTSTTPSVDVVAVRRAIGMVFQKPNPFPTMSIFDNVAAGLRLDAAQGRRHRSERVEESLRGAGLWDEVKDRLGTPGHRPLRRPAAAAVHRAHDRRRARGDPHGRAVLGPRPDRDAEDRGADRASSSATTRSSSSRTTCSRPRVSPTRRRSSCSATSSSTRRPSKIFSNPDDSRTEEYVTGKFG